MNEVKNISPIYRYLALKNESRGKDSTGIGLIDLSGNSFIVKKTIPSTEFLNLEYVNNKLDVQINRETKTILGHTRAATTGAINFENSQPFIYKNIVGTHNGMIHNHAEVFDLKGLPAFTTCDSEAIFAVLSQAESLQEKAQAMSDLRGWLAIAFYDQNKKGSLYFARHNNNVSIRMTKNFIFWSSSFAVMDELERVFNLKLADVKLKDDSMLEITENGEFNYASFKIKSYFGALIHSPKSRLPFRFKPNFDRKINKKKRGLFAGQKVKTFCECCHKHKKCRLSKLWNMFLCRDCIQYFSNYTTTEL